ncbi:hypothetical protein D3C73_1379360 [compost metagenome]
MNGEESAQRQAEQLRAGEAGGCNSHALKNPFLRQKNRDGCPHLRGYECRAYAGEEPEQQHAPESGCGCAERS